MTLDADPRVVEDEHTETTPAIGSRRGVRQAVSSTVDGSSSQEFSGRAMTVSFAVLALLVAIGLAGPLLALPAKPRLPVVVGELTAGIGIGHFGVGVVSADDPTLTFLGEIGFALVMFVAGSHVPIRSPDLIRGIKTGAARTVGVAIAATVLAWLICTVFDTDSFGLYAVLMASSSAAIIMPIVESEKLSGPGILALLPQIALADAICIVAVPLVIDPPHAGRAALGAAAVIASAIVVFLILRHYNATGVRRRIHRLSTRRQYALELRINLAILFGLSAVAVYAHVSIMLAGFSFGLAVAAIGEPRRLTHQLFALTEGFLGPIYFVWLGMSLDLRSLGSHPKMIGLGLVLGLGAVAIHVAMKVTKQATWIAVLSAAQLGVPVSAVTLGTQLHVFSPGEAPAIILGALITIGSAAIAGPRLLDSNATSGRSDK